MSGELDAGAEVMVTVLGILDSPENEKLTVKIEKVRGLSGQVAREHVASVKFAQNPAKGQNAWYETYEVKVTLERPAGATDRGPGRIVHRALGSGGKVDGERVIWLKIKDE